MDQSNVERQLAATLRCTTIGEVLSSRRLQTAFKNLFAGAQPKQCRPLFPKSWRVRKATSRKPDRKKACAGDSLVNSTSSHTGKNHPDAVPYAPPTKGASLFRGPFGCDETLFQAQQFFKSNLEGLPNYECRVTRLGRVVQGLLQAQGRGIDLYGDIFSGQESIFQTEQYTLPQDRVRRLSATYKKIEDRGHNSDCLKRIRTLFIGHEIACVHRTGDKWVLDPGVLTLREALDIDKQELQKEFRRNQRYIKIAKSFELGLLLELGNNVEWYWHNLSKADIALLARFHKSYLNLDQNHTQALNRSTATTIVEGLMSYGWSLEELAQSPSELVQVLKKHYQPLNERISISRQHLCSDSEETNLLGPLHHAHSSHAVAVSPTAWPSFSSAGNTTGMSDLDGPLSSWQQQAVQQDEVEGSLTSWQQQVIESGNLNGTLSSLQPQVIPPGNSNRSSNVWQQHAVQPGNLDRSLGSWQQQVIQPGNSDGLLSPWQQQAIQPGNLETPLNFWLQQAVEQNDGDRPLNSWQQQVVQPGEFDGQLSFWRRGQLSHSRTDGTHSDSVAYCRDIQPNSSFSGTAAYHPNT